MTDQTPQTTTEPVAWRIRPKGALGDVMGFQIVTNRYVAQDYAEQPAFDVQSLYTAPQPLAIGLDREGPGGWLIKDTLNGGWVWTPTRIAAVAALTEGRQIWSVDHGKYESACLPAAPTGGRS